MATTLEGMTHTAWIALPEHHREALRDLSGLSPQLVDLEGWRVEAVEHDGTVRRFIVGRSTGWKPCSIALPRQNSVGGMPAELSYARVTRLYKVR